VTVEIMIIGQQIITGGMETVQVTPLGMTFNHPTLLPNLNVLVAVSNGMRAVKLYSNKIL